MTNSANLAASGAASEAKPPAVARWRVRLCFLAVGLALAAWWLSFQLTLLSGGANTADFIRDTCANAGQTVDCASVIATEYGSLRLSANPSAPRLPVAVLGMAYFSAIALWYALAAPASRSALHWHVLLLVLHALGACASVGWLFTMAFVLRQWCLWCVVVHVLNGMLLAIGVLLTPWRARPGAATWPVARAAFATLTAMLAIGLLQVVGVVLLASNARGVRATQTLGNLYQDPNFIVWRFDQTPEQRIPPRVGAEAVALGPADAAHTIVLFIDFQCTACARAAQFFDQLRERHARDLRLVIRHFPQNNACNPGYPRRSHPFACDAAWAYEALTRLADADAAAQARAWLYARQRNLGQIEWADFAAEFDLDADAFSALRSSDAAADAVRDDAALAASLGVRGAPGVYLDGKRVEQWLNADAWDQLLTRDGARPALSAPTGP